jgi:hypothetical protein
MPCECPHCNSTKIVATYRCDPCNRPNHPVAVGWTEWKTHQAETEPPHPPPDGVPARQQCPGCGQNRDAIHVICSDCGQSWVPQYP